MNFTKNIKYLAISVVSIGTLYLGYIQFKNFQRRLHKLERDVRVIQSNIENTKRTEHFVENKPERRVTFSPSTSNETTSAPVPTQTSSVKDISKNMNILETITIEDDEIGAMSNEQLDKLEAELENYETESEYDSTSEDDDGEEEEDTEVETTLESVVVHEPLKEIHILNQYIHLNDEELHTEFSKNTCPELRDLLKKCGLSSGGKKEVLIQRLISHKKSISSITTNE